MKFELPCLVADYSDTHALISFDEMMPGPGIRVAVVKGVSYMPIRDIIVYLCVTDNRQATNRWRELPLVFKQAISRFCRNLQLPGRGQKQKPVITFQGAVELIKSMRCKASVPHRADMIGILQKYFANNSSESHDGEDTIPASAKLITLKQVAREEGYTLNRSQVIKIGRLVVDAYRAKYGLEPFKNKPGQCERKIKLYPAHARGLIKEKIAEVME